MTLAQTADALELPEELIVALELRQEAARVHDRFHAAQGHVSALPIFRDRVQEVEHRKSIEQARVTLRHRFVGGEIVRTVVAAVLHAQSIQAKPGCVQPIEG